MKTHFRMIATLLLAIWWVPVYAHTGGEAQHSLITGLGHPWSSLGHWLVLFGLGLYAAGLKRRASIALPMTFLTAMTAGIGLAYLGFALSAVEGNIAVSLLMIGSLLMLKSPFSPALIAPLLAYFALFHGFAHGIEIYSGGNEESFLAGLILSSVFISFIGSLAGQVRTKLFNHLKLSTALASILLAAFTLVY